jgi:hypothetical protein
MSSEYKKGAMASVLYTGFVLTFWGEGSFSELIWEFIVCNVGYHMLHYSISQIFLRQVERMIRRSKFLGNVHKAMMKFTAVFIIFGAIAMAGAALVLAVFNTRFEQLIILVPALGCGLGGIELYKNLTVSRNLEDF